MIEVEICINSDSEQNIADSVGAAYFGGASRVELCSAMHLEGLTPTIEQIKLARKAFKERPGLMVMIRPRPGDFCYNLQEAEQMKTQIITAAEAGADGVVFGILKNKDNTPDIDRIEDLMKITSQYNLKVTFHRAFDAVPDPLKTAEIFIQLGINRILTSGTRWGYKETALDGINRLKQIIEIAGERIEIIIGGGINPKNVKDILNRLPLPGNNISVHSYSGVQEKGFTKLEAVKSLVSAVKGMKSSH